MLVMRLSKDFEALLCAFHPDQEARIQELQQQMQDGLVRRSLSSENVVATYASFLVGDFDEGAGRLARMVRWDASSQRT
jgi:hypothetical protein